PFKGSAMADAIQVGCILLCGGSVLEPGRGRNFWLYDQSTDRALLHAGIEHDGGACAWSTLRRLRNSRPGTAVVLSARHEARTEMAGAADLVCFLGHQYRLDAGDRF